MLFPGQGSQSVGMLAELAARSAIIRETFAEASDVLSYDLWKLASEGPAEQLDQTEQTQPAMLVGGVAVWRAWREAGGAMPTQMAGHSLGEYTALVCAGAMSFADAVGAVRYRAQLMQAAVPAGEGAMAAVLGLDDDAVRAVCAAASGGQVLEAVNFNAPGQVVIAGNRAAVERGVEAAKTRGAKLTKILPVSVPAHSSLMKPAAAKLLQRLDGIAIKSPAVPVLHNIDAQVRSDAAGIRQALANQLYGPVQWVKTIESVISTGTSTFLECGPGNVLTGLNRRIQRSAVAQSMNEPAAFDKALGVAKEAA
jgi:[acyl-carrier-protein] S-malonyltransferase